MITPIDAYALSLVLTGGALNGERDRLSGPARRMVDHLDALDLEARGPAWDAMLAVWDDGPELVKAVAMADPSGPPPGSETTEAPSRPPAAHVGDLRDASTGDGWLWEGYIPAARISGIAASEGVGKTRLALDLARRVWHALPWPDGQAPTLPAETSSLWVCADGQQEEFLKATEALGLPDQALRFNTPRDEPYGGTGIDATEDRQRLEDYIRMHKPGLVFIDTLTNATSYDLCRQTETKDAITPLRDIAQRTGVAIVLLMHLSKDGQALGLRIRGLTRTIIHLERPDPEQSARLRMWVEKSFATKPPPLGVTMGDGGNEYDHDPPTGPLPGRPGPPPAKLKAAMDWVADQLTPNPRRVSELRKEAARAGVISSESSAQTLYRARDELGAVEYEHDNRKWWRLPVRDVQDANSDNSDNPDIVVRDVQVP